VPEDPTVRPLPTPSSDCSHLSHWAHLPCASLGISPSLDSAQTQPSTWQAPCGDEAEQARLLRCHENHTVTTLPSPPQVLLTIAGMLPFKPVFLGQAVRPAPRVTTTQKCAPSRAVSPHDCKNGGKGVRIASPTSRHPQQPSTPQPRRRGRASHVKAMRSAEILKRTLDAACNAYPAV
jgi:hypothetical protein